ncbi:hypothetical protein J5Y04_11455 [Kitasatospora sp. RG8]|uniref:hypothetical protein n=1 Tax=Kitasatospora sp. RG8 TaxID=2820815 RepID=UPI001AE0C17D|nr:hypothetical protein [Kitasatospora sp. RG8]MBP0450165.1 hypothetical protein [Kitasatospora sp. RG8]
MRTPRSEYGPGMLGEELGLSQRLMRRARRLGHVPEPDVEGGRWSRAAAEALVERRDDIAAELAAEEAARAARLAEETARERDDYGPEVLRRRLGLVGWQFAEARERGLVPEPDVEGGHWSAAVEAGLRAGLPRILAALGDGPRVGAVKAARALADSTGLEVTAADVQQLAEAGVLRAAGEYKGWPTYSQEALAAVPAEALEEVVATRLVRVEAAAEAEAQARTRRLADSLSEAEAAEELGWSARRLQLFAARGGLTRGPDGRYDRAEVLARYAADPWRGESAG